MSDNVKTKLISAGYTFASVFIVTAAATITTVGAVEWTLAFWGAVVSAAIRAGIQAIISTYVPARLGGKKA